MGVIRVNHGGNGGHVPQNLYWVGMAMMLFPRIQHL